MWVVREENKTKSISNNTKHKVNSDYVATSLTITVILPLVLLQNPCFLANFSFHSLIQALKSTWHYILLNILILYFFLPLLKQFYYVLNLYSLLSSFYLRSLQGSYSRNKIKRRWSTIAHNFQNCDGEPVSIHKTNERNTVDDFSK